MVDPVSLMEMFKLRDAHLRVNGIPEGCQFRGFYLCPYAGKLSIVVEHDNFEFVPEGEVIPELVIEIGVIDLPQKRIIIP